MTPPAIPIVKLIGSLSVNDYFSISLINSFTTARLGLLLYFEDFSSSLQPSPDRLAKIGPVVLWRTNTNGQYMCRCIITAQNP